MSTRAQKDVSLEYSEDEKTALAPSKLELYQIALSTRNFEISLFWERSNYFLGLNTAIAVGFFALDDPYRRVFAVLGFLSSCLWFRVCLGGKFWQTRWEQRLKQVEHAFFPQLRFFSASEEQINADVMQGLDDRGNWLRGSI
jgi:hypothetical protein